VCIEFFFNALYLVRKIITSIDDLFINFCRIDSNQIQHDLESNYLYCFFFFQPIFIHINFILVTNSNSNFQRNINKFKTMEAVRNVNNANH